MVESPKTEKSLAVSIKKELDREDELNTLKKKLEDLTKVKNGI